MRSASQTASGSSFLAESSSDGKLHQTLQRSVCVCLCVCVRGRVGQVLGVLGKATPDSPGDSVAEEPAVASCNWVK